MGTLRGLFLIWVGFVCVSCAAPAIRTRNAAYSPSTGERIGQVVRQPFSDFRLYQTQIPPLLLRTSAAPYAAPARTDCSSLKAEVEAITQVLGPDMDPARLDRRGGIVSDGEAAAWGTARGAAEGWIPFHGVVRELTGAARHDRQVERAILSGFVRRAYLRGLMEGRCP